MKPKNQPVASQSDATNTGASDTPSDTQANKLATAIDVLAVDEHAGKPGSYVFDPGTGKRSKAA